MLDEPRTERRVAIFVGTRPEAIKLAPVIQAVERHPDLRPIVVSTGQHSEMLRAALSNFGILPDLELEVMTPNQTLASLTSTLLTRIDRTLREFSPDFTIVQGDTTTTMVGALTSFYLGIPVGHVEAGLRTGDLRHPFPEEANRKMVSQVARMHFAPTDRSRQNLIDEGFAEDSVLVTGNTVIDALFLELNRQAQPESQRAIRKELEARHGAPHDARPYVLITGHRRESFGDGFERICGAIATLATRHPHIDFVYPVHLNPRVREPVFRLLGGRSNIRLIEPLDYRLFVRQMADALLILTDSGGVQEEAPSLSKPVLVMRNTTERPEGVDAGTVRLVGTDDRVIVEETSRLIEDQGAYDAMAQRANPYGDGRASERIVEALGELWISACVP